MAVDSQGRRYWRSLEEFLETPEFEEMLHREFPEQASEWTDPVTRRRFLTLMGASLALMGLNGCSTQPAPREKIMPYVRQPEAIVPGKALYFATAMPLAGVVTGVLVESHEGRPTKIEGNPSHPASLGASDLLAQASILGLYDPDRSQSVTYRGRPRSWNEMLSALRGALGKLKNQDGEGLYILTENVVSPTLAAQLNELLDDEHFPEAKWFQYEPAGRSNVLEGAGMVFSEYVNTYYDFTKADVVLSLDADFLMSGPGTLRYTRDFTDRRRVRTRGTKPQDVKMNRLYVVECGLSNTGGVADHRLALRASQIELFAQALAAELEVPDAPKPQADRLPEEARRWLKPLTKDLREHEKKGVVLAGEGQPASLHALVHAINHQLKNLGETVRYTAPLGAKPVDHGRQIEELVKDMDERRVKVLLILGVNPVYTAPVNLQFAEKLKKVPLRIHLGLYQDETAALCDWHIPEAHYLEGWSDGRAYDGTASIIQPLIAPLYNGRTAHEVLAAFTESPERAGLEIVREHWRDWWKEQKQSGSFEEFWRQALEKGFIEARESKYEHRDRAPMTGWAERVAKAAQDRSAGDGKSLEIIFRPDSAVFDGRFANNGWLQELPNPVTKITWDNAAIVSPKTAKKLGITYVDRIRDASGRPASTGGEHGQAFVDVIELSYRGRAVKAPVWIVPGHADDAVTVHLGYGRSRAGRVGNHVGFNAYALRTSNALLFDSGLKATKVPGAQHSLACTQMHHNMEERAPIRTASLVRFKELWEKGKSFADELTAGEAEKPEVLAQVPGPEPRGRAEKKLTEDEEKGKSDNRLIPLTLYKDADKEFEEASKQAGEPGKEPTKSYQWAMAIDLTTCTGCSACVVACQSENNIPVVGKEEVTRGREMHWIRIDRYYEGDPFDPNQVSAHFQPVPCMQCEKAPCELVCPVGATVHSHDGLNDMIYNRCVGTRYCSNNCPYKVRRFNFLQFADFSTSSLKLMHNPEVTVRSRGVMEKCTYCVQRIRAADIEAQREGRRIGDRDLLTACQAVCPAQAIIFGDLSNKDSAVYQCKEEPTNYALLAGLNTLPRTTYLAALRNPNPELTSSQPKQGE
ncbi:MAG TPA: TAT-variant-translocated molybdopterin oxidoreductase [Gemmataceae bacterium]|nr:TAT-variant-translocated molybdopterin oxidoreductase [Gemmataceae bacterium]